MSTRTNALALLNVLIGHAPTGAKRAKLVTRLLKVDALEDLKALVEGGHDGDDEAFHKEMDDFQAAVGAVIPTSGYEVEVLRGRLAALDAINEEQRSKLEAYEKQQPLVKVLRDELFRLRRAALQGLQGGGAGPMPEDARVSTRAISGRFAAVGGGMDGLVDLSRGSVALPSPDESVRDGVPSSVRQGASQSIAEEPDETEVAGSETKQGMESSTVAANAAASPVPPPVGVAAPPAVVGGLAPPVAGGLAPPPRTSVTGSASSGPFDPEACEWFIASFTLPFRGTAWKSSKSSCAQQMKSEQLFLSLKFLVAWNVANPLQWCAYLSLGTQCDAFSGVCAGVANHMATLGFHKWSVSQKAPQTTEFSSMSGTGMVSIGGVMRS